MNLPELCIRRPVMTTLVMAAILLFAVLAFLIISYFAWWAFWKILTYT